jgi:hypothetical protein
MKAGYSEPEAQRVETLSQTGNSPLSHKPILTEKPVKIDRSAYEQLAFGCYRKKKAPACP